LARLEGGAVEEVVLPPLRSVLRRDSEVVGEALKAAKIDIVGGENGGPK